MVPYYYPFPTANDTAQEMPTELCVRDGVCPAPYNLLPTEINVDRLKDNVATQCGVSIHDIEDIWPCSPLQAALMAVNLKAPEAYICQFQLCRRQSDRSQATEACVGPTEERRVDIEELNRLVPSHVRYHPTSNFL